jgi:hypothetical protein
MISLNFILFIFCIVRRNSFLNKRYQFFIGRVSEVFSWIFIQFGFYVDGFSLLCYALGYLLC